MLDAENRIKAAAYFLERARLEVNLGNESELKWNIQASVVFAVSSIEVLPKDFSRMVGSGHSSRERKNTFRNWYAETVPLIGIYKQMNNERDLILHPGEPDKIVEHPHLRMYFPWDREHTADSLCRSFIRSVESFLAKARIEFAELATN